MKRINLDQMKNMSIDNLIEIYKDGYRLEEHTTITSLSDFNTSNFPNILSNIRTLQGPLLDPVINFGKVTVSIGYDAVATSIILNTNDGSKLPDPSSGAYNLVWWNSTDYPDPSDDPNKEIVRCTAKTTDTLTVTRSQEGTSASIKNLVGKIYKMIISPTAKMMSDISSAITARIVKSGDTMTGTLNLPSNGLIVGTNQLVVSGGNVGIGTGSPTALMHIYSAGKPEFKLEGNTGLGQEGTQLRIINDAADTISRRTELGFYSGITRNWAFMADISANGGQTFGLLDSRASIYRMFVDSVGNVGIGTTSPTAKLHVGGTSGVDGIKFPDGTLQTTAASGSGTMLLRALPNPTINQWFNESYIDDSNIATACYSVHSGTGATLTLQYDLGVIKNALIHVYGRNEGGDQFSGTLNMNVSINGTVWKQVFSYTNNAGTNTDVFDAYNGFVRYIRFQHIAGNGTRFAYLYEVSLFTLQ